MATKTDRIMSYLPATFKAAQTRSPLKTVVNTFGTELLFAENSLAALMRAHWVDHADKGAKTIDDLARFAALYGLAPRADAEVEEFREQLKQYVKTLLQGTVTVQGLLRIAANNLALKINDDYQAMDTWWTRQSDELALLQHCGNDAATKLFAEKQLTVFGAAATPASIKGSVLLTEPIDLTGDGVFTSGTLHIKLKDSAKKTIDLFAAVADPTAISAEEIITAINAPFASDVAAIDNGYLRLTALTAGSDSELLVEEHTNDAAPIVLGLQLHTAKGQAQSQASITSTVDLSGSHDLTESRYLRLRIDNNQLQEIDCAGANPAATTLDEIRDAINAGFSSTIASHDGQFLKLQSTTLGSGSSIAFLTAAAQDAVGKLFGSPPTVINGHDKLAAQIISPFDFKNGVDLSNDYILRIRVNAATAVNVDCRGLNPANSQLPEMVNLINDTLGKNVASHNGKTLVLTSTTQGVASKLILEHVDAHDAIERLFGIRRRTASGNDATNAEIISPVDLSADCNLMARYLLRIALDFTDAVDIELTSHSAKASQVTLDEMVNAINSALGQTIASHDGQFLKLASSTSGSASALKILPVEIENKRRFVTRAKIIDEASDKILGFNAIKVTGEDPIAAQVTGGIDLSRGVDLRGAQYLSLQINQNPPVTIDCAGPRPRATLISEVTDNINNAIGETVAYDDNGFLKLIAPVDTDSDEATSKIKFHLPNETDALDTLLALPTGQVRGRDASSVSFVGTVDLSAGVDLTTNHTLKLKIDNDGPLEINCSGLVANQTTLAQIAIAINIAFAKNYATHDGKHLLLTSLLSGTDSLIEIQTPAAADASSLILGVTTPRIYQGIAALPAKVTGLVDLSGDSVNLSQHRFLQLGIDSNETQSIDCAVNAADILQVTRSEIIDAINNSVGLTVATDNGGFLTITSTTVGLSSRINMQAHTESDARLLLLGDIADEHTGTAATSAQLTGEVDLNPGVDLSDRNQLKIAFDGKPPIDITVLAATPESSFGEEIADAINRVEPQSASVTDTGFLQILSSTSGVNSSIEILPVRYLEIEEYLPTTPPNAQDFAVNHGTAVTVDNAGAAEVQSEISINAPQGSFGAGVVNHDSGWHLRILAPIHAGETLTVKAHPQYGIEAVIFPPDPIKGFTEGYRKVAATDVFIGPILPHMHVPTDETWRLAKGENQIDGLVLNNSLAPNIVQLQSQLSNKSIDGKRPGAIKVKVVNSNLSEIKLPLKQRVSEIGQQLTPSNSTYRFIGKLAADGNQFKLLDATDQLLVIFHPTEKINFSRYLDSVVVVIGELVTEAASLVDELLVENIALLFDVDLSQKTSGQPQISEQYSSVTIGEELITSLSLQQKLIFGDKPSALARATLHKKSAILKVAKGRTQWRFIECDASRFNASYFTDHNKVFSRFAGSPSIEQGLTNISQMTNQPPQRVAPVFAESNKQYLHVNQLSFNFLQRQPGSVRVNLPADLAPRFGGRLNDAIFGLASDTPEKFEKVVTEPDSDPQNLVTQINNQSILVEAKKVDFVPIGFSAVTIPFAKKVEFTLGSQTAPAKVYLAEIDVPGFIELSAKSAGVWGNQLSVIVCDSGPAIFDVLIHFPGSRFENARAKVLGDEVTAVVNESLKPGSIGVRQAKASGVKIEVTRDNCPSRKS